MTLPLPPVALTCGDPAGVGPEIAVKARLALGNEVPLVWIGDPRHLPEGTDWREVDTPQAALDTAPGTLAVMPQDFSASAIPGTPDHRNAAGTIGAIERAVAMTVAGQTSAVCTCPVSKQILQEGAGFAHPGHTEFLAHLAGVSRVVMMLASPVLRVVPLTIHIPLAEVAKTLDADLIRETIAITRTALQRYFAIDEPRIAVAGLNPHAGEAGRIGTEERDLIIPVIRELRGKGWQVTGPLPADTMFHAAARERYDVAVAMYHDQALIPIKALDFDRGVNVTLGLPFVRTSPDHGTAFDIAGQNLANPDSLIHALRMAWHMAGARA